jgi:hypothetical protein
MSQVESYPPLPGATPKRAPTYRAMHAHYHPIKVSQKWAEMVAAMVSLRTNSPAYDAARDRERHNETTYARGKTGAS